jgi:hypothetical protein
MVVKTEEIFVFLPKAFTPRWDITIDGTSIKNDVLEASFSKLATIGIGDFKIKLNNTAAKNSGKWIGSETAYFYADLTAGTTLKFKGRIDFVKEILGSDGMFIDIEGRHISFSLAEIHVSKAYAAEDGAVILKNLVDTFLTGFTYANVPASIGPPDVTVNWSNKPFWECVNDLCTLCGADCYVDDNLDFHLFLANSIINNNDAVVESYNLRELKGFGTDSYFERTKIIVYGEDDKGLPIIFTKGTGTREKIIKDSSIKTMAEAEDRATKEYSDSTLANIPPQGTSVSYGLPTVEPGENIWISSPRQQIHGLYKMVDIKHEVGSKTGYWKTTCKVEIEEKGTSQVLRDTKRKELALTKIENPNRMEYSYNFTFDDLANIATQSYTQVSGGKLILTTGATAGVMTTATKAADNTITSVELRYEGANLDASTFEVSADNGVNYQTVVRNTLTTVDHVGTNLKIKVTLTESGTTRPEIDSLCILFK